MIVTEKRQRRLETTASKLIPDEILYQEHLSEWWGNARVCLCGRWGGGGGGDRSGSLTSISAAWRSVALTVFRRERWNCLRNINECVGRLHEYHCGWLAESEVIIFHLEEQRERCSQGDGVSVVPADTHGFNLNIHYLLCVSACVCLCVCVFVCVCVCPPDDMFSVFMSTRVIRQIPEIDWLYLCSEMFTFENKSVLQSCLKNEERLSCSHTWATCPTNSHPQNLKTHF